MDENNSIQLFEDRKIRTAWDEEQEEWYFSVQDVIAVLAESSDPKQYIKKMRARDPELSANWGTICTPVQMLAADGKMRKIQAANTEGLLRIIQSIPSPKAEPFKRWLAQKKDADNFISTSFKSVSIGIYNYLLFTSRFFIARTFSGSPNRVMNPSASW